LLSQVCLKNLWSFKISLKASTFACASISNTSLKPPNCNRFSIFNLFWQVCTSWGCTSLILVPSCLFKDLNLSAFRFVYS
jgi:hypothetical protein